MASVADPQNEEENDAVANFRQYLRIQTVQPEPNYGAAEMLLKILAQEIGLDVKSVQPVQRKPFCIMSWPGTDPSLPSLMLYSHMDVVPVFQEHWKYHPFSATKTENGNIYARGAQDMKCVGIQYLEAIRALKKEEFKPLRTVHVVFGSDNELGGKEGMAVFVNHPEFEKLNVGFVLDEGLANSGPGYRVFYGERSIWWLNVKFCGNPGHGSSLLTNTAGEKMNTFVSRMYQLREEQRNKLKSSPNLSIGDVVSINLTMINGGVQVNVVPAEIEVGFDVRVPPTVNVTELEEKINQFCRDAGEDVSFDFRHEGLPQKLTSLDDADPWAHAFLEACREQKMELKKEIFPAATDSRYIRERGIPVLGFSPMNNTPVLHHDHNEFLNEKVFLRGIEIYCSVITHLSRVG